MHCPSCRCLINSCTSEYILLDTFAPRRFRLAHSASLCCLITHSKLTMMSCSNLGNTATKPSHARLLISQDQGLLPAVPKIHLGAQD